MYRGLSLSIRRARQAWPPGWRRPFERRGRRTLVDVEELRRHWNAWGEQDPLWAALAKPEKWDGRWDVDEFFATGREHVDDLLERLTAMGLSFPRRSALDFGCGVGRLTRALSAHFEDTVGLDVAPSMIALAERLDDNSGRRRFIVNVRDDLRCFADRTFDFVGAFLVLQHMPPALAKRYLAEFVRVLSPEGVLVFQVPSRPEVVVAPKPLPEEAFRAKLRFSELPRVVIARSVFQVRVHVKNESPVTWPTLGENPIHLGNHWIDSTGNCLRRDDGRTALPTEVEPGGEVELFLVCTAPPDPGEYILEVDLVQEGVTWFSARGADGARGALTVIQAPAGQAEQTESPLQIGRSTPAEPRMETFAIPLGEVVAGLEENGAIVQSVRKDLAAGERWRSYEYVVTRGA